MEHALDPKYAGKLGVDVDNLLVSQPDYAEQALEITNALIASGAVDVLIVDSVAALVPKSELDGVQVELEGFVALWVGVVFDREAGLRQLAGFELLDVGEACSDGRNAARLRKLPQFLHQADQGVDGIVLGGDQIGVHALQECAG